MTTTGRTTTGGVAESQYFGAIVETARVVNVNVADWSLDLASEYGNKRFFDIQWMNPYLHYIGGEGIYVMPEVGALCWICTPSAGKMATPFVLGFKTEIDERDDGNGPPLNFRANRQTLNPGDMMMRTRDENFVILRRGGVVQIGANPIAQRIFIPIGNIIRDICESYLLQSFAGDMHWAVDRVDQSDAGQVKTRLVLRSKTTAADPEHAVILTTGSHPDDDNLRLSLIVRPSGASGEIDVVSLTMDKEGSVNWAVEKEWVLTAKGRISLTTTEGDVELSSKKGKGTFKGSGAILIQSEKDKMELIAKATALLKAAGVTVDAKTISLKGKTQIGGPGGEPAVKGVQLMNLLIELIRGLVDASNPHGPVNTPPGFPTLLPVVAKLLPQVQKILSTNHTVT